MRSSGVRAVALVCCAVLASAAVAAGADSLPRASACGDGFALRPQYVLLGCGDGGQYLDNVRWSSWASRSAQGTAVWYRNLCKPDCAAGNFRHSPVTITLTRPRSCRRPALLLFTRMTLHGADTGRTVVKIPYAGATSCP